MYSVLGYGTMIADRIRTDAYAHALQRTINQGDLVVEIGTGATGIFAILACKFGARKVYAFEPDDSIELAREIVRANGFSDRIELIQSPSTRVDLPEKADVIFSDLRGVLPLFQQHIPAILDARSRLLAPAGKLIPRQDTMWAAVVESPKHYEQFSDPWEQGVLGVDLRVAKPLVRNSWVRAKEITTEQLLTVPECWATLDYSTIESPDVRGEASWRPTRDGTAHGICLWFDASLWDGINLSNAPGAASLIWGSAFFPLSEPVELTRGDLVRVSFSADLVGGDYIWRWDTVILEQCDSRAIKADFKQSTFFGTLMSPAQLRKGAANYMPTLNKEGQLDSFVLAHMNGRMSSAEIARQLMESLPDSFADEVDALTRVGVLAQKYSG